MKNESVNRLTKYGMLIALIFILGLTPVGYIKIPGVADITIIHIPVILGAYFLGVRGGALLGFFFGLTSFLHGLMSPDVTAAIIFGTATGFGIYNVLLIVCVVFLPRILVGLFAGLVFRALSKVDKSRVFAMIAAAVVGSLTNTVLFLGGLYLLAFEQTAAAVGVAGDALLGVMLGIVTLNGLLEAAAAAVVCPAVGKALQVTAQLAE